MGAVLEYKYLTLLDNENLLSSFFKKMFIHFMLFLVITCE